MPLTPGQTLEGRYLIQALLHQGGMGAVYRALDQSINCVVAIKERTPDPLANANALAQARVQFQREAQILGNLSHPALPRVTNYFSSGGNEYLVMDFVEGSSLESMLQAYGSFNEATVIAWAHQLLAALAYIHSRNVIHRDLKPSNLILKPDGKIMLVDFGLVKLMDPNDPRTLNAMRGMGTPEYAPLEQYAGTTTHTDARSDIYALGATLYHLLTGRPPLQVHQRMLDQTQQPTPRALNTNISPAMEALVLKAMQIYPQDRFANATEMRQALADVARGGAPTVPYVTPPQPPVATPPPYIAPPVAAPVPKPPVPTIAWLAIGLGFTVIAFLIGLFVAAVIILPNLVPTPRAAIIITATPAPTSIQTPTPASAAPPLAPTVPAPTLAPGAPTVSAPTLTPTSAATVAPPTTTRIPPTVAPPTPTLTPVVAVAPGTEGMVFVPASDFWMGAADVDPAAAPDEKPGALVYVSAFWIDKYEISNAQFKACVDAGKCDAPSGVYSPQAPHEAYGNAQFDNYPVVLISQYNASRYCVWKGKSLPFETQWEKAARGNQDQRLYPWGKDWDGYNANAGKGEPGPAQVNAYPGGCSPYGACNMAGNVAEWIADNYSSNWYSVRRTNNLLRDPVFWDSGLKPQFNVRGGSFKSSIADARVSKRASQKGDNAVMNDVGFRCVKATP